METDYKIIPIIKNGIEFMYAPGRYIKIIYICRTWFMRHIIGRKPFKIIEIPCMSFESNPFHGCIMNFGSIRLLFRSETNKSFIFGWYVDDTLDNYIHVYLKNEYQMYFQKFTKKWLCSIDTSTPA